jgi:Glycosyl transferase family group 2
VSLGDPVSISLVVVNKDDRGIIDTLAALRRLPPEPGWKLETIVVDASGGCLDDVRRAYPEARWIPFEPDPSKPTIAEQRNVGVSASDSDIVVFIDASCIPDGGWLPALIGPLVSDGEMLVAGSHRSAGKRGIRDEVRHFIGDRRYIDEASTLNLAVARPVFELVGGFDGDFHYGSDVDFTWRAVDAGCRIRYVPEAVVAHQWGSLRSDMRRSFQYGQARYRLYAKHPRRLRTAWRHDPEAVAYPLFLLIAPLAAINPWIAALLAIPFVKNLRHRPLLTVVDHLVYGAGILTAAAESWTGWEPGRAIDPMKPPPHRRCHRLRRSGGGMPTG